jgi:hypothetical protein
VIGKTALGFIRGQSAPAPKEPAKPKQKQNTPWQMGDILFKIDENLL